MTIELETVFTQQHVGTYIQFVPGWETIFLGNCVTLDALPKPRSGGNEYIYCWNDARDGYDVRGRTPSTPGNTEYTLSHLLEAAASALEQVNCPFSLYAVMTIVGAPKTFGDWERAAVVGSNEIIEDSITPVASHNEANPLTFEASIQAPPNRLDFHEVKVVSKGDPDPVSAETISAMAIYGPDNCRDYLYSLNGPGYKRVLALTPAVGVAAEVYLSEDGGASWTATAAQPFAADIQINAIGWFPINKDTDRIYAFAETQVGVPLEGAYSDDNGATWTSVNVGATNAEFASNNNQAFFVSGSSQMAVVTDQGNLYMSDDGGLTWEADNFIGTNSTGQLYAVEFRGRYGIVTGADPDVFITTDGGKNWSIAPTSTTGAGTGYYGAAILDGDRFLVGDVGPDPDGNLYITADAGNTWEARNYAGFATNGVQAMHYLNDYFGILIDTAGDVFITVDGGWEWQQIQDPGTVVFGKVASTIHGFLASTAEAMSLVQSES